MPINNPGFTLTVPSPDVELSQGGVGIANVSLAWGSYTGSIKLAIEQALQHNDNIVIDGQFSPNPVAAPPGNTMSVLLNLTTTAPPGTYERLVVGETDNGQSSWCLIFIKVPEQNSSPKFKKSYD